MIVEEAIITENKHVSELDNEVTGDRYGKDLIEGIDIKGEIYFLYVF